MKTLVPTYEEKFEINDMPRWARKHKEVFELCKRDLAFRCDVFSAETQQYRKFLIREAQRRLSWRK